MLSTSKGLGRVAYNFCARIHVVPAARIGRQRRLQALAAINNPIGARLAMVLQQLRADEPDESARWSHRIEAKRRELAVCRNVIEGQTVRHVCSASKKQRPATLLHLLIREFKPQSALELGTCIGISSAYQAAAMKLNGQGRLVTLEGSRSRIQLAQEVHQDLGLDNITYIQGRFSDTLPHALNAGEPVEYAFIDGHHQEKPTIEYFEMIRPLAADNCIMIFDDIRWSPGMWSAWQQVVAHPSTRIAVDLVSVGICVITPTLHAGSRHSTAPILA